MSCIDFIYTTKVGKEHDLVVEYDSSPYVPARMYLSNGDPGYPEEGGEFDLYSIKSNGVEIIDRLNRKFIDRIKDQLIDYLED